MRTLMDHELDSVNGGQGGQPKDVQKAKKFSDKFEDVTVGEMVGQGESPGTAKKDSP
jgi:hypothetical protein